MKLRAALLFTFLFSAAGVAADAPEPLQGLDAYVQKVMAQCMPAWACAARASRRQVIYKRPDSVAIMNKR